MALQVFALFQTFQDFKKTWSKEYFKRKCSAIQNLYTHTSATLTHFLGLPVHRNVGPGDRLVGLVCKPVAESSKCNDNIW